MQSNASSQRSHRQLPVLSASPGKASLLSLQTEDGGCADDTWRWNPDAKLVRTETSEVVLINYANQLSLILDKDLGKEVSFVSGLTVPFFLPASLPSDTRQTLIDYGFFLRANQLSHYENKVRERLASALHNSYGLIIMPTEKCNFRCTYCYEDFMRGRMSNRNADIVSKAIERIATTVDDFSLSFFGGEPLLCADLVKRFSEEAFELMKHRGLPYSAGIATNGYLLNENLFEELLDVGVVSYQITIDGSQEVHDQQRRTASGLSTFEKIVSNINKFTEIDGDFWCVIRCNLHKKDYEQVLTLFRNGELDKICRDKRFVVDLHEIWASDGLDLQATEEASGCSLAFNTVMDHYAVGRELERLGFGTTTYSSGSFETLGKSCYAGKPNWFVVGPDLALYKCTVVFNREENKLGYIAEDGTLVIDKFKNQLWTGSNALTDQGCVSCHYRVPCGGIACPLTRFTEGSKVCPDIKQPANLQKWANAMSAHHSRT